MDEARAELAEAHAGLAAAQVSVAEQQTLATERQKRFTLLSATFKRKEEGFAVQLAAARDESAAVRAELAAVQQAAAAAREVSEIAVPLLARRAPMMPLFVHFNLGSSRASHIGNTECTRCCVTHNLIVHLPGAVGCLQLVGRTISYQQKARTGLRHCRIHTLTI